MEDKLEECKSKNALKEYLERKALNHNYFKVYGERDKIEYIVETKSIYLSTGVKWADGTDYENIQKDGYITFARCFSYSKSESVAMWMLYGPLMINFNPSIITNIVNKQNEHTFEVGTFIENKFKSIKVIENLEIIFTDVLYYAPQEQSNVTYVKRSDEHVEEYNMDRASDINYCKKTLPWSYENEVRLLVRVPKKELEDISEDLSELNLKISLNEFDFSQNVYETPNALHKEGKYNSSNIGEMRWDLSQYKNEV